MERLRFQLLAWLLVLLSALVVVFLSHQARERYARVEILDSEVNELQTKWGQLLLEESILSSHAVIEQEARENLGLEKASDAQIKVLESE